MRPVFLLVPLLLYVLILWFFAARQEDLIFPGHLSQGLAYAVVLPPPDAELVRLKTAGGENVVALFGTALGRGGSPLPDPKSRPTLLYFYGNGDCLRHNLGQFEKLRRLGTNVMIPDYLGYGMSAGKPSEQGLYATADAAYAHLLTLKEVDPKKIVVAGSSIGGAVAIDLASRKLVAGLATFSTFTTMTDMARRRTLGILPVGLFLRHKFDSEAKIARVKCPILMGHGDRDINIPPSMMNRLAAAARVPAATFTVKGAGHNDLFSNEDVNDAASPYALLRRFLDRL